MKFSLSRSLTLIAQESEQLNSVSFRVLGLLFSVTAHVLVYLSIGIAHGERGDRLNGGAAAGETLDVRLLPLPAAAPGTIKSNQIESPVKAPPHRRGQLDGDPIGNPETLARNLAPLFEITLPPQPYYFPTDQLTEKPQVAQDIPPELALALSGASPRAAILRLLINENGDIDQVIIEESNFSEEEKNRIIEACKKMKFKPGKLEEIPVNTEMLIELTIDGGDPGKSHSTHP
ncbi:MAG: hypothetical protein V4634_23460 [Pseudomonadota bacterium]